MRWNETCELVSRTYEMDGEGVPVPKETRRRVFCNKRHAGAATWYSMSEMGVSIDAILQLRTCDYGGQEDVLYRGERHTVETVDESGDFTVLTLRKQQSDTNPEGVE